MNVLALYHDYFGGVTCGYYCLSPCVVASTNRPRLRPPAPELGQGHRRGQIRGPLPRQSERPEGRLDMGNVREGRSETTMATEDVNTSKTRLNV